MDEVLSRSQKDFLLETARKAIEFYLLKGETIDPDSSDKALNESRGAFVTIKIKGQLRGCIGYPLPIKPLLETIVEMAINAATEDYRFQSLRLKELPDTQIEISVLSLPHEIANVEEIEVGTHGIIVSDGPLKGLLLPQVPVEWNWDRETFLKHGCLKAGLDEDAWKTGAKIEVFSAEVFSE
ncbi:AmmeMemoRadiSam system protein A [Acidobacteriota bacterium]